MNKKQQKLIRFTAVLQSGYALIEIIDCIYAVLMALGVAANIYPKMLFAEAQTLFDEQPIWLVPYFCSIPLCV